METPGENYNKVRHVPLSEIARTFFLLGCLGFGGPAAHLALMEREFIERRGWLSHQHFLDLLAAINLVPGPNSTEMAIQIGYELGGLWGLLLAGAGFIIPAVVLSIALAMIYVTAGSLPAVHGLFIGVQPVILVLILSAAYRLGQKAIDSRAMWILLVLALIFVALNSTPLMSLFGVGTIYIPELIILLACGALYTLGWRPKLSAILAGPVIGGAHLSGLLSSLPVPTVLDMFWRFFVIGGTLFGSGYVLAAYMQRAFVDNLHWLTPQQLIDVLAIGQSTPGPVLSTSSAAGYVMTATHGDLGTGIPGAIAATLGVFLPAFVIVLILGRILPYLRRYSIIQDFLKGVNAGVIALLIMAFVNLAFGTLVKASGFDWLSLVLTGLAFYASERLKWSPLRLVVIGAGVGLIRIVLGLG